MFAWRRATGSAKHAGVNAACRWCAGSLPVCLLLVCGQTLWPKYVRDVAVPLGFARPWLEVRSRGAVPWGSAKHAGVNAGERDNWRYRARCLLLVCGICAAFVGSAFTWRRATGERKTCWRKRGVSPVSGIIGGFM